MGQLHCLGATQTFARGNFRENGPTNILCSYANVGSMMYSTGASNSFNSYYTEKIIIRIKKLRKRKKLK